MKFTLEDIENYINTSKYKGKEQIICNFEFLLEDMEDCKTDNVAEFVKDNINMYSYTCEYCEKQFEYSEFDYVKDEYEKKLFCCSNCRNSIDDYKDQLKEQKRWDSLSYAEQAEEMIQKLDPEEQPLFRYVENELEKHGYEIYHVSEGSLYFERDENDDDKTGYERIRISNHEVRYNPMNHEDHASRWLNALDQIIIYNHFGNLMSMENVKLKLQELIQPSTEE
jgi:hypothetical protein